MLSLSTPIEQLKKVGPQYVKKLHKLGLKTVRDLFFHFPHRYDDFSQIVPINQLMVGEKATIQGKILEISNRPTFRRRLTLTEAVIEDETGAIKVVWFNQPYLISTLGPGRKVALAGQVSFSDDGLYFSNPTYEILSAHLIHTARLVPVYPETAGLTSRYLRYLIKSILPLTKQITDFLPEQIKKELALMNLSQALNQIHFPNTFELADQARQRLGFDELFLIQLMVLKQKQDLAQAKAINIPFNQRLIKSFVQSLPFELTDGQRIAAWEIFQDLTKPKPMNRLLNGDVGSGKTVVATMAGLATAKAGFQVALMAPTEVLAKQHFQTMKELLGKSNLNIALLVGSGQKLLGKKTGQLLNISRPQLKKQVAQGEIDLVVGTHALIQENLSFKKLALAIVDEQHRFGVRQRASLTQKSAFVPHLLSMTATPIPRTLALTIYGDLDISLLKELPAGRQKVITQVIPPANRQKAYNLIREQIKKGRQAFVICPLIEDSEKLEVQSVTDEYKKLSKKVFPKLSLAMLHGHLRPKEKEKIMKDFAANKTNILISTSVVEVGVDIPNATVMMIEGADRFGLAQLHQFRGRVGRSHHQSYCLLFTDSTAKKTHQRLKALLTCQDGFELAEKDLQIRGPGHFYGTRQWGLPDLTMASLNDLELIQQARQSAARVINQNLWNPALIEKLKTFQQTIHFE